MNHFTWTQYLEAIGALLVIYYAVVLFKLYLPEVNTVLDRRPASMPVMSVLQYEEPAAAEEIEDPLVARTEQLIARLKQTIAGAYQPAAIQKIFREFQDLKDTQLRPAINELVVTECEKNGAALLTEAEVNEWWEV